MCGETFDGHWLCRAQSADRAKRWILVQVDPVPGYRKLVEDQTKERACEAAAGGRTVKYLVEGPDMVEPEEELIRDWAHEAAVIAWLSLQQ